MEDQENDATSPTTDQEPMEVDQPVETAAAETWKPPTADEIR